MLPVLVVTASTVLQDYMFMVVGKLIPRLARRQSICMDTNYMMFMSFRDNAALSVTLLFCRSSRRVLQPSTPYNRLRFGPRRSSRGR